MADLRAKYKELRIPSDDSDISESDEEDMEKIDAPKLPFLIINPTELLDLDTECQEEAKGELATKYPQLVLREGDLVSKTIEDYAKTYFLDDRTICSLYEHVVYKLEQIKQFAAA